jgi:sec-independent protein translocase protein TatA
MGGMFEPWHLIIIIAVILLFFGGKKIPELMRGLGKGMKEFKDASNGETGGGSSNNTPPTNTNTNTYTGNDDKPRV